MPSVELIAVGTEMLLGDLLDTNTGYVARCMAAHGIDVRATHAVGDNRARIAQAIREALGRADGVITTGGLGPTVDDLTKEAACDALGLSTQLHEPSLRWMESIFAAFGRAMTPNNLKQAELPIGASVLENPLGTAPGFVVFRADGGFVACLPGPPREMRPMLAERLVPLLRARFQLDATIVERTLHTIGLGESDLDSRIDDLFRAGENPKIAVLAHDFRADVKIMAKAASREEGERMIAPLQREIAMRLDGFVFGVDDATPASAVLERLRERGWKLATAESCTGGRIAAALTAVPGASEAFVGGIVAYDDAVKREQLGVTTQTLEGNGAVSRASVLAMAQGARARLGCDVALATSGIAGPSGGTPEKPVGLVWLALDTGDRPPQAWSRTFHGDREAVQARATLWALGTLWREMKPT